MTLGLSLALFTLADIVGHFYITPFGVAFRGNTMLKIAWIGNSILG